MSGVYKTIFRVYNLNVNNRSWRSWITHQTPTLKIMGSNPFGRATKNPSFVYHDKRGIFFVYGAKWPEIQKKQLKTGVGTVDQTVPAPVFCILAAAEAQYFCLPFREIKGYAADIERGFEVKNSASAKRVTKKYGFPIYFYR